MSHYHSHQADTYLARLGKKINKRYKERWTVGNVHAVSDQQSDALAKSRSWFVHVYVSKTNEKL